MTTRALVVAVALLLCPPPLAAQGIPEPWRGRLSEIEQVRLTGRYQTAEAGARVLAEEMAVSLPAGESSGKLLAMALTFQALAAVELKRYDDALGAWQLAQNLNPRLRTAPIPESYASAGDWLAARRLRLVGTLPEGAGAPSSAATPRGTPSIELSEENYLQWRGHAMTVEVVVDREGRAHSPVVIGGAENPGKVYFLLSSLSSWRFEPARVAGEPVPALFRIDDTAFRLANSPRFGPGYRLLREGRWQEARAMAEVDLAADLACLARDAPRRCGLAGSLALKALALAGAGQHDAAVRTWRRLYSFSPRLARDDLADFEPEIRQLLGAHTLPCPASDACAIPRLADGPGPRPPRPLATPPVHVPAELGPAVVAERLIAEVVVDASGHVREPVMRAGHSPVAGYLALETLDQWRFEPALEERRPVAVVFELSIPLAPAAPRAEVDTWRQGMEGLDGRLRTGDWQAARDSAGELVAEIAAGSGAGGSDLLARAVSQLALAEAGLGLEQPALWHWHAAQNLAVQLRHRDLSEYGAAGVLLSAHRLRRPGEAASDEAPGKADPSPDLPWLDGPAPRFPDLPEVPDSAEIELIVDRNGIPRSPLVLAGRGPGHLWALLEAVREWRFEAKRRRAPALRHRLTLPLAPGGLLSDLEALPADEPDAAELVKAAGKIAFSESKLARCYLRAAQQLDPALARIELSHPPATVVASSDHWSYGVTGAGPRARPERDPVPPTADNVTPPRKISARDPSYTKKARRARIQGPVILQAIIDREGHVVDAKVRLGLSLGLNAEAIKAACSWRFRPATLDGEPVPVYHNILINFRLK